MTDGNEPSEIPDFSIPHVSTGEGIRTLTVPLLRRLPLPIGLHQHTAEDGFEPPPDGFRDRCPTVRPLRNVTSVLHVLCLMLLSVTISTYEFALFKLLNDPLNCHTVLHRSGNFEILITIVVGINRARTFAVSTTSTSVLELIFVYYTTTLYALLASPLYLDCLSTQIRFVLSLLLLLGILIRHHLLVYRKVREKVPRVGFEPTFTRSEKPVSLP